MKVTIMMKSGIIMCAALVLAACDKTDNAKNSGTTGDYVKYTRDKLPTRDDVDPSLPVELAEYVEIGQWVPIDATNAVSLGLTGRTRILQLLPDNGYNVVMVKTDCARKTYSVEGEARTKSSETDVGAPTMPKKQSPAVPDIAPFMDRICGLVETEVYEGPTNFVTEKLRKGSPTAKSANPIPGAERVAIIRSAAETASTGTGESNNQTE